MTEKRLLRLKKQIDSRRPKFIRQESWRYKRVKPNWRRPKGIDNKMAERRKGYPRIAGVGYRGPKAVRGIHPSGYNIVHVANVSQLDDVDPEKDAIIIRRTVGERKRQKIVEGAEDLRIKIINKPVARVEIGEVLDEVDLGEEFELLEDDEFELDEDSELEDDSESDESED